MLVTILINLAKYLLTLFINKRGGLSERHDVFIEH